MVDEILPAVSPVLNLRCVKCPAEWYCQGHDTFTWRECVCFSASSILAFGLHIIQVAHAIENERMHLSKNCWQLLTSQASIFVRGREVPVGMAGDNAWSCTHCAVHLEYRVPQEAAIIHAKEEFDIFPLHMCCLNLTTPVPGILLKIQL
jgi:hypothetical protein